MSSYDCSTLQRNATFTDISWLEYMLRCVQQDENTKEPRSYFQPGIKNMSNTGIRQYDGTTIAEFAPTLLIAFCFVVFPMFALGTVGIRYALLANAANLAAQAACKQKTFLADTNTNANNGLIQLSAVHTAQNVAAMACTKIGGSAKGVSGITLNSTNVYIKINPMGNSPSVTQPAANTPLSAAANTDNYAYDCEVILTAKILPLLSGWKGMVGNIPLLNAPLVTSAKADYLFESTNNLNM